MAHNAIFHPIRYLYLRLTGQGWCGQCMKTEDGLRASIDMESCRTERKMFVNEKREADIVGIKSRLVERCPECGHEYYNSWWVDTKRTIWYHNECDC